MKMQVDHSRIKEACFGLINADARDKEKVAAALAKFLIDEGVIREETRGDITQFSVTIILPEPTK